MPFTANQLFLAEQPSGATQVLGTAASNGAATVSCSIVRGRTLPASVTGAATVTASVVRVRARAAAVAGVATVSAAVTRLKIRSAAVAGAATVSASVTRLKIRSAAVAGHATVSATLGHIKAISGAVAGAATVAASIKRTRARAAAVAGAATITASVKRVRARAATVNGTAAVSVTLTGGITFSYQWEHDTAGNGVYTNIQGAINSTYTVVSGDNNCHVRCAIIAYNAYGSANAYSNALMIGAKQIVTAPVQGRATVTATLSGGITFAFQWQRDNSGGNVFSNIGGATSSTYLLVSADHGCQVRCVVTATNAIGSTSANSNVGIVDAIFLPFYGIGTLSPLVPFPLQASRIAIRSGATVSCSVVVGGQIKLLTAASTGRALVAATVSKGKFLPAAVANGVATVTLSAAVGWGVLPWGGAWGGTGGAGFVRVRARTAVANGAATVSATRLKSGSLVPVVHGVAVAACALGRVRARAAASTGRATITAAITRTRARAAAVLGAAIVACTLGRIRARAAAATGRATVACSVSSGKQLNIFVNGAAAFTAQLRKALRLGGASNGTATVNATLFRLRAIPAAVATGRTTTTATLRRDRTRTATATGTAAVSASIRIDHGLPFTSAVTGSAFIDCQVSRERARSYVAVGAATVHVTFSVTGLFFGAPSTGFLDRDLIGRLDHNLEGSFS